MPSFRGLFLTRESNCSLMSPALAGRLLTTSATWEAPRLYFFSSDLSDPEVEFCSSRLYEQWTGLLDQEGLLLSHQPPGQEMDRRGKDPASWISQPQPAPPHPSLGDSTTKLPALHKHCLSHTLSYHVSRETWGIRVTGGCHEAEMFSVCSGERFR